MTPATCLSVATARSSDLAPVLGGTVPLAEIAFALTAAAALVWAFWLAAPHMIKLVVVGAGLLTAGALALVRLPVSGAAVFLLILAAASLVMEVTTAPGLLLYAVGGGVALGMGGLCLHEPGAGAHPAIVVPVSATVTAGTWAAGRRSWWATREDPFADSGLLVGRVATVLDADGEDGHAVVAGQVWAVTGRTGPVTAGCRVRVIAHRDGRLVVTVLDVPPP